MSRDKEQAPHPQSDPAMIRRYFSYIHAPGYCTVSRIVEPCGIQASTGQFVRHAEYPRRWEMGTDDADAYVREMIRPLSVSVYTIPNPVIPEYLAKDPKTVHRFGKAEKGSSTNDDHVALLRWITLDVDAKRPMGDISATDFERAIAIDRRDQILEALKLRDHSIWGTTGNGGFIFPRLGDLANTPANRELVSLFVDALHRMFSDAYADLDLKAKNPSRLMAVPGTAKCKGGNTIERPWRLATLDVPEGHAPAPIPDLGDLYHSLPDRFKADPKAGRPSAVSVAVPRRAGPGGLPAIDRARAFVAKIPPAISGQGGHNQTFYAATTLVKGFGLPRHEAETVLREYNQRCSPPWSDSELAHKLDDAEAKPGPCGDLLNEPPANGHAHANGHTNANGNGFHDPSARFAIDLGGPGDGPPESPGGGSGPGGEPGEPGDPYPPIAAALADIPHRLAEVFMEGYQSEGGPSLSYFRQNWVVWDGSAFRAIPKDEFEATVSAFLDALYQRVFAHEMGALSRVGDPDKARKPPKARKVTAPLVRDVVQAIRSQNIIPG